MTKTRRKLTVSKRALTESKKHPNSNEALRDLAEKVLVLAEEMLEQLEKAEEKKNVVDQALMLLYEHDQNIAQAKMFVPSREPNKMWPQDSV